MSRTPRAFAAWAQGARRSAPPFDDSAYRALVIVGVVVVVVLSTRYRLWRPM